MSTLLKGFIKQFNFLQLQQSQSSSKTLTFHAQRSHQYHGKIIMIVRQFSRLGSGGGGGGACNSNNDRWSFVAQLQKAYNSFDVKSQKRNLLFPQLSSSPLFRRMFSNVNPSKSDKDNVAQNNNNNSNNANSTKEVNGNAGDHGEVIIKRGDPEIYFDMSKSFSRSDTWKSKLISTMLVYPNFITKEEEESLMKEIEPYISRLHYETAHWDAAIHDYRETERSKWNKQNEKIINRIRELAFPVGVPQLKLVHILDLAKMGVIKPHIDSIRFCGNTIAGLSLLSDSVMRLCHDVQKDFFCDVLLPRRSLYVMNDFSRYEFTHEILGESESTFKNQSISRDRRVSIICRNEPDTTPGPVFKPLISDST